MKKHIMMRSVWVSYCFVLCCLTSGCETKSTGAMPAPKSPFSKEAFELAAAVNAGDSGNLSSIIARDVNPFIVMGDGTTMLHAACVLSKADCVAVLIGVVTPSELNRPDINGRTPLHHAASSFIESTQIVSDLLEAGADPTIADAEGRIPLDIARGNGYSDIVELLSVIRSP